MKDVSFTLAFLAGMASFLSPCVMPLIPSYISYITGISFTNLREGLDRSTIRRVTFINSLSFILGFSTVFILLGAGSSFMGSLLTRFQDIIRIVGGILIIIFGLFIAGIINIRFLMREKTIEVKKKPAGVIGSFLIGMAFAAGWTPCIGPILGSILLYASAKGSAPYGMQLLAIYSLGMGLPFLISSMAINTFLSYSRKIQRYMRIITILSGLILIAFGILLITGSTGTLTRYMPDLGIKL